MLVALYDVQPHEPLGPLARALQARASRLGEAFRRVVFAQVRISAVNTILTGLYLFVALPLAGVHFAVGQNGASLSHSSSGYFRWSEISSPIRSS